MKISTTPVRGTKDFLPNEAQLREYVQNKIADVYKQYGFTKISTPIMEDINRLEKSDGGENLAMIFKIMKRGQKLDLNKENLTEADLSDSGLRYDLTMPLSRYFANNRQNLTMPFKSIQIDKVFRAERPQKGRLREFFQCDIDIIGDKSINAEMELIKTTTTALMSIGFENFTIRINDRRILNDMIIFAGFAPEDVSSVCIIFDKLDKIGMDGVKEELLEKEYDNNVVQNFMKILSETSGNTLDSLSNYVKNTDIIEDIKRVIDFANKISKGKFKAIYDKSLVRGMGYYTGMVFEVASSKYSSSVAGGGRYDNMVGNFIGEDIPAVGFSIGFERICDILSEEKATIPTPDKLILIYNNEDDFSEVMNKVDDLQEKGYFVNTLKRSKKLKKQIDSLVEIGYKFSYSFGGNDEIKELS